MNTANWLTLIGILLLFLPTYGGLLVRVRTMEALVAELRKALEKSRGSQGGRLGDLERRADRTDLLLAVPALVRDRVRSQTGGIPIVGPLHAGGDESGET